MKIIIEIAILDFALKKGGTAILEIGPCVAS